MNVLAPSQVSGGLKFSGVMELAQTGSQTQLLNIKKFCMMVIKHGYYSKLNYINLSLNTFFKGNKYSKHFVMVLLYYDYYLWHLEVFHIYVM